MADSRTSTIGPVTRLYLKTTQGERVIVFVPHICSMEAVKPDGTCEIRTQDRCSIFVQIELSKLWELLNPPDASYTSEAQ